MAKKRKFVDTSNLPRKNTNGHTIDWKKSIGYQCSFIYGDLSGEIEIIGYEQHPKNSKIEIKYKENKAYIPISNFKQGNIGEVLKLFTKDFKFSIGEVLKTKNSEIKIIDRFYKSIDSRNRKYYKYQCIRCKQFNITTESILIKGSGCPVCTGRKVCVGVNDIATMAKWMIPYFEKYEDSQKYTVCSDSEIYPICPTCHKKSNKKIPISQIYNAHSIGCKCDTYMSFPETVVYNLLEQFNINFIHGATKKHLKWANRYRYDFYLPNYNAIIEVHGMQHYSKGFSNLGGKTLKEEKSNDKQKRDLASSNGIKYYYEIDCRKSNLNWILNSIFNSKFLNLIDVSFDKINIDMLYSSVFNKKIEKCKELINKNQNISNKDLCKQLNICPETLNKILKIIGINRDDNCKKSFNLRKPISLYKDGILLYTFNSQADLIRNSKDLCGIDVKIHDFSKYIKKQIVYKNHYTFKNAKIEREVFYA